MLVPTPVCQDISGEPNWWWNEPAYSCNPKAHLCDQPLSSTKWVLPQVPQWPATFFCLQDGQCSARWCSTQTDVWVQGWCWNSLLFHMFEFGGWEGLPSPRWWIFAGVQAAPNQLLEDGNWCWCVFHHWQARCQERWIDCKLTTKHGSKHVVLAFPSMGFCLTHWWGQFWNQLLHLPMTGCIAFWAMVFLQHACFLGWVPLRNTCLFTRLCLSTCHCGTIPSTMPASWTSYSVTRKRRTIRKVQLSSAVPLKL